MTDHVLTEEDVAQLESLAMRWNNYPRELAQPCVRLIASHRLLQERVDHLMKVIEDATKLALQLQKRDYVP